MGIISCETVVSLSSKQYHSHQFNCVKSQDTLHHRAYGRMVPLNQPLRRRSRSSPSQYLRAILQRGAASSIIALSLSLLCSADLATASTRLASGPEIQPFPTLVTHPPLIRTRRSSPQHHSPPSSPQTPHGTPRVPVLSAPRHQPQPHQPGSVRS